MPERNEAVYVISVAAELAGVHPQTLRVYERKGLVRPKRTAGNTRRYSASDIERLQRICDLTDEGVNLAGARLILDLEQQLDRMRRRLDEMADRVAELEEDLARDMRLMARAATSILPARSHRTLEDMLAELRRKGVGGRRGGPIPMGPAGAR
jgi:MerR family transcriptional regulator/heat shock protein HspR